MVCNSISLKTKSNTEMEMSEQRTMSNGCFRTAREMMSFFIVSPENINKLLTRFYFYGIMTAW